MKYPDAPVLCNTCRDDPLLPAISFAAIIRDDEQPPRCPLCGFRVTPDGAQLPEPP